MHKILMFKVFRLLLLACLFGSLQNFSKAAFADPITGMVGVGTWNTQADFADVRVTQGTTTLYQSSFATGMTGWTTLGGSWQTTADGYLRQTGNDTPALALVGSPAWSNYTVTLRARKNSGAEGFLISFGSPGDGTKTWWNIGGWGDTLSALEVPGVWLPSVGNTIQSGVWYSIRIEVQRTGIRCYLDGALVHDTARILNAEERQSRFSDLLSSPGFSLVNVWEQQWLRDLAGRDVYIGAAARATFAAVPGPATLAAMTAAEQAAVIRKVNRNRLTWNTGFGFGSDLWRDQTIIDSMDSTVLLHNQLGLFDMHLTANNSPGTPTADASYGGYIRFGGSNNYRTALHESSHALGTGTYWMWGQLMVNGLWNGFYTNDQLSQFDGNGAVLRGDSQHCWPYGLNYDSEYSDVNAYRHVLLVQAMRRDMGIATLDVAGATDIPNGVYTLVPRHAQSATLNVLNANGGNSAPIDIHASTNSDSQKFLLDLQSDGSYRIRTALPGNRCLDLPFGDTSNGNKLQLWDDNGNDAQRWFLISTGDGWYRLAPKNNIYKGMDVNGGPGATADGTSVQSWDYLDGSNQQWKLVLLPNPAPTLSNLSPNHAPAGSGTFTLTVNGAGFVPASVVKWNGGALSTTFVSSTQLTVSVPASVLAAPGTATVTAVNPTPGGGASGSLNFTVQAVATDVSSQVQVKRGGFRYNRTDGTFVQQVTLTNRSGSAVRGPVSLVLESLIGTLVNRSGATSATTPTGQPYLTVSEANMAAGSSVTVILTFTQSVSNGISYTTRVFDGSGAL